MAQDNNPTLLTQTVNLEGGPYADRTLEVDLPGGYPPLHARIEGPAGPQLYAFAREEGGRSVLEHKGDWDSLLRRYEIVSEFYAH